MNLIFKSNHDMIRYLTSNQGYIRTCNLDNISFVENYVVQDMIFFRKAKCKMIRNIEWHYIGIFGFWIKLFY